MDVFSEVTVSKKAVKDPEKFKRNLKIWCWVMTVLGIGMSFYLLIPAVILWILYFLAKRFLDFDYEYIHVNDEFDIDMVMGGISRKTLMSFPLSQVITIAPWGDPQLDEYSHVKAVDYSARNPDDRPYVMICVYKEEVKKLYLQLNDKMLHTLKLRIPSKIKIHRNV